MNCRVSLLGITLSLLLVGCSALGRADVAQEGPLKSDELLPTPPVVASSPSNQGQMLPIAAQAQMAGQRILLEVTRTPQEQAMGLMYRTALADDRGMLFSFASPRPVSFWMMNVKIPLDMVFLRNGEVKAIAADVPPCTTSPCPTYGPADAIDQVIELRGDGRHKSVSKWATP